MRKLIIILLCLIFNVGMVNASEFLIMCDGVNAGQTDVCEYLLMTQDSIVCPAVIGTDCVPGVVDTPLSGAFVSSINLPEGFILKNCKVSSNNAICNVSNNVVTITPNSLPFNGDIEGTIEVQIPANAQEGPVGTEGFSGHVNYTYNKIDKLYVDKDIIDIKDGVTSYKYTTDKSSVNISVHTSNAATVSGFTSPVKLEYGENKINIKVISQSGVDKNYTLTITRKDTRSDDSTLKYINTSDVNIDFNSLKTDYSIIVGDENVTIYSEPTNAGAKVEYLDGKVVQLKYNETKKIRIKVTSEKGNVTIYSVTLTRKDLRNDDTSLIQLSVNDRGVDLSSSKKDYFVNVTSASNTINAVKNDSRSKLEYLNGTSVSLNYGETRTLKIKVTSEKGTSSIYSITLTRKDTRNNDATLKSLIVTNTDIKYNKNSTYNTQVENSVSKIDIKATATNSKATVSGIGVKNLNVGNNTFVVTVTAENGDTKNYVIVINRKAKASGDDQNKVSSDNNLKSLIINEINFDFDKDILDYNLFVDYNVDKINVDYVASSDKATVTMTDLSYLEIGLNIIDLIVVAENGAVKTYTLNVTRRPERLVVDNNDEEILGLINSDSYDDIYVIDEKINAPYIISSEVLSALRDTGKTIIYEIMDDDAILYQLKFVGGELNSINDFQFEVNFNSSNSFKIDDIIGSQDYLVFSFDTKGDAVGGAHLSIYKYSQIQPKESVDLYEYDEDKNKLNLILGDLDIKDNVIELEVDDLTKEYVIADINSVETTGKKISESTMINLPLIFVLVAFFVVVASLVIIKIKKHKTNKKHSNIDEISNFDQNDSNN